MNCRGETDCEDAFKWMMEKVYNFRFSLFPSRGAFARNTVLKILNLSHNNIKKLDANSLRGMRLLR
jgi:hypothetical protein